MKLIYIISVFSIFFIACGSKEGNGIIMTVNGPLQAEKIGVTLTHEHILVDFIGADSINESRWIKSAVIAKVLPYLKEIKKLGCQTFIDCTPSYLGRDPLLLKLLSDSSGLNIVTNTGFYGANKNKYISGFALTETPDQMSDKWTDEWVNGINGTGIKPGFIKIAVERDSLSDFHKKLVTAAARTHLRTGLTIASHTGPSLPAFQELEILRKEGVAPEAFIWVHASNEKDSLKIIEAASMGAWISFDKLNDNNVQEILFLVKMMKQNNLLGKLLISHDAGWYDPAKENGGPLRGYTTLFEKLIPEMKKEKFTDKEIHQLLAINPAKAFAVRVRKK